MSRFNDDYESSDGSEDTDATVRELRTEIIRLEAQLDQLTASVRERTAESALIQARLTDLELRVAHLESRRRRDARLLRLTWVLIFLSLALWGYSYAVYISK